METKNLNAEDLKILVEESKLYTVGGYYYKKLLIDPLPALIIWTKDDKIEAYEIKDENSYSLLRSINVRNIKSATSGQGTMTIKLNDEPMMNLLLDEEFRNKTIGGMKGNVVRGIIGNVVGGGIVDLAMDVKNLKTDSQYIKNQKLAKENEWSNLLKEQGIKSSSASDIVSGKGMKIVIGVITIFALIGLFSYFIS